MKLSKSLIQSVMVGLAIGTTISSCSMFEDSKDTHLKSCEENCTIDHSYPGNLYDNCPACGLG